MVSQNWPLVSRTASQTSSLEPSYVSCNSKLLILCQSHNFVTAYQSTSWLKLCYRNSHLGILMSLFAKLYNWPMASFDWPISHNSATAYQSTLWLKLCYRNLHMAVLMKLFVEVRLTMVNFDWPISNNFATAYKNSSELKLCYRNLHMTFLMNFFVTLCEWPMTCSDWPNNSWVPGWIVAIVTHVWRLFLKMCACPMVDFD